MNPSASVARRALALLALVLITSCTAARDVPDDYGSTTERNFNEGCVTSMTEDPGDGPSYATSAAQGVCRCAYEEVTSPSGLTYERFREINDSQEAQPSELPGDLREIIDRCRRTDAGPDGG